MASKARSRITIIGTGLIGTSIGLRLAERKDRTYEIAGLDRDRTHLKRAKKMGAIDKETGSLEESLNGASVVILAVPVGAAQRILSDMAPYVSEGTVVTDTCSTKTAVGRAAEEFLPNGVHFVGGHPIAGKERSGPDGAEATLFQDSAWALAPSPRASEGAVGLVLGLVEFMGSIPVYIDPEEHDQYLAAVSHVPLLLSVGLFRMARDSTAWEDLAIMSGPGFRDMTRLASGDAEMGRDIVATNREAVVHWLRRLQEELRSIEHAVVEGPEVVRDLLASTSLDRDAYLLNPPRRRVPEGQPLPSSRDALGQMFAGALYDKLKEAEQRMPEVGDERELRRRLEAADREAGDRGKER